MSDFTHRGMNFWGCLGISCFGICVSAAGLFIAFIIILGSMIKGFTPTVPTHSEETPGVAVIEVRGVITAREGTGFSSENIAAAEIVCGNLDSAITDPAIWAIVLLLDTPGGEVVASDLIYRKVLEAREAGIPVVACMETTAASGGYYIAAGCDKIFAHPYTITGSIGVIVSGLKYHELFDNIGLAEESFTSGDNKSMLSGGKPTSDDAADIMTEMIDDIYSGFVEVVAQGRGIDAAVIRSGAIGDGRIFTGKQAKAIKLVDELGGENEAIAAAAELGELGEGFEIYHYTLEPRWSRMIQEFLSFRAAPDTLKVELPGSPAEQLVQMNRGKPYYLMY